MVGKSLSEVLGETDFQLADLEDTFEDSMGTLGSSIGTHIGAIFGPGFAQLGDLLGSFLGNQIERLWETENERKDREEKERDRLKRRADAERRAREKRHKELLARFNKMLEIQGLIFDNTTAFLADSTDRTANVFVSLDTQGEAFDRNVGRSIRDRQRERRIYD